MCSPELCTIFILIPAHAVSPIDSSYNYDQTMSARSSDCNCLFPYAHHQQGVQTSCHLRIHEAG